MIADTNIFIRYFLNDIEDLANKATFYIENFDIILLNEVFAEIIYVLEKIYKIPRLKISMILNNLLTSETIINENKIILINSLEYYSATRFDIVDCILISFNNISKTQVISFDKKLLKKLI